MKFYIGDEVYVTDFTYDTDPGNTYKVSDTSYIIIRKSKKYENIYYLKKAPKGRKEYACNKHGLYKSKEHAQYVCTSMNKEIVLGGVLDDIQECL